MSASVCVCVYCVLAVVCRVESVNLEKLHHQRNEVEAKGKGKGIREGMEWKNGHSEKNCKK